MAEETSNNVYITWRDRTWIKMEVFQKGQVVNIPDAPKEGDFLGWYTLPDGRGLRLNKPFTATRNDTFWGHWKTQNHTVSGYEQQGLCTISVRDSDGTIYEIQVPHGTTIQSLPTIQKDGRTFLGWFYANGNRLDYSSPVMNDIVVYAHWDFIKYPITWVTDGHGVFSSSVLQEYTVENWGYVPPPMESETEWRFDGWEPEEILPNTIGPITFTAKWKQEHYDITIDPNGGTLPSHFETQFQRTYNQKVYADGLPTPTLEGYDFIGWKCGSETVTGDTKVKHSMVIKATWQIKMFTVVKFPASDMADHQQIQVAWGHTIPEEFLAPGTRVKFAFVGWYTRLDGGIPVDKNTVIKSDLTIYGFWRSAIKYRVTYDANGGTFNSMILKYEADPATEIATIETADCPNPTMTGYLFDGWMDEQGGSAPITDEYYEISSDMSLYAKWIEDELKVRLHSNGGIIKTENWED